jgi:tetratricopeptide (TPR) repeat protein
MSTVGNSVKAILRLLVAAACCLGIWSSLRLAEADYEYRQDTEASILAAIRSIPDGWPYYMRLAQLDRQNAATLLKSALRLNEYDAQANIELGLSYEADGDFAAAEKQLLQAHEIDNTYLPRWSLAGFYFRRGNLPEFWKWARNSADMPSDDIGALLDLCWRAEPDPMKITGAILNQKPEFLRQYVNFLLAKDQPRAAAGVVQALLQRGDTRSDLPFMYVVVNRLVAANEPSVAFDLWHQLIQNQWVTADWTVPNNGAFLRTPLPVKLDWSFPEYEGLHSWPGPSGLETEIAGNQPEDCTIAEQSLILTPGAYFLVFDYKTSGISPYSGIRWQLLDPKSQKVVAETGDLSSEKLKKAELGFTVTPGSTLLTLRLKYHRTLGTVRVAGTLNVQKVQIQVRPT